MTRGGGATMRPDDVARSAAGVVAAGTGTGAGDVMAGRGGRAGGVPKTGARTGPDGGRCGKSGVVFALGGAPVSGGAAERGGGAAGALGLGVLEILGIGFVTAVDQAGGMFVTGAGSNWPEVFMGSVVAAETFGRGVPLILAEAGLSGRGGRLMRKVSRFGAFGSVPSGVAESAILFLFIVISENVQW